MMSRTLTEERVIDEIMYRQRLGREKYGVGIDYNMPLDFLDEATEELADGLQYIVAYKMKQCDILNDVYSILSELIDDTSIDEDIGDCLRYIDNRLHELSK